MPLQLHDAKLVMANKTAHAHSIGRSLEPTRIVSTVTVTESMCPQRKSLTQEKRYIYFFSDVPLLMKTVRNCELMWAQSQEELMGRCDVNLLILSTSLCI